MRIFNYIGNVCFLHKEEHVTIFSEIVSRPDILIQEQTIDYILNDDFTILHSSLSKKLNPHIGFRRRFNLNAALLLMLLLCTLTPKGKR